MVPINAVLIAELLPIILPTQRIRFNTACLNRT